MTSFAKSLSILLLYIATSTALLVPGPFHSRLSPKREWISYASVATTIALLTVTANANAADVGKGGEIFQQNCSTCHRDGMNAIAKERTLQKEALEKFVGLDVESVSNFVKNSEVHRGALAFVGRMTDDDFNDVSAFIVEKASENKW